MLASVIVGLLGLAAPVGPTDETAVYEPVVEPIAPEPVGVEPVGPEPVGPEPVGPEPVAPETEPAPALEPATEPPLPAPFVPSTLALPPPPPPPTGAGRLVGGAFSIALGLGAASVVIVESTQAGGTPTGVAATFIPLGLAGIGIGTFLLIKGAKARGNYNDWRAYTDREALPTGEGLIVGGIMSSLIGGVTLVAASVQSREPDAFAEPLTPTLFAIGGTGVVVGATTLTLGLLRRGKYVSWRQSTFLGSLTPSLAPTLTPTTGGSFALTGASVGLRFRL